MADLIQDNIAALQQLAGVISSLGDEQYAENLSSAESSIGSHARHILNHYEALLGPERDTIDYDQRERGTSIERNREEALLKIDGLIRELGFHDGSADRPLIVSDSASSFSRELKFVHQHTIHHFALIALFMKQFALPVPHDLGMSPATVKFLAHSRLR